INLDVQPGWQVSASTAGGPISLDLGGTLGQLSQLNASVAVGATDVRNLAAALGDISITGANIAPAALASFGSLDQVALSIPGKGGTYDLSQLTGSAQLKITAFPGAPVSLGLQYANGQLSTQAEVDVDVHALIPQLAGNLKVGYASGAAQPLSVHATDIKASDPRIAQYVSVPNVTYANGTLSGDLKFASGPVTVGPISGQISNGQLHFEKGTGAPQITGSVEVQMGAGGAASATGHVSYDSSGQLKVEGTVAVDLGPLTGGAMTGTLTASNEGGANSLSCKNANFAAGPLASVFPSGITVNKVGEAITASASLDAGALQRLLPDGATIAGGLELAVNVTGGKPHFSATGEAKVTVGSIFTGAVTLADDDGGLGATLTVPENGITLKVPGATINGSLTLHMNSQKQLSLLDGEVTVDVLGGTVKAKATPIIDGGKVTGADVAGTVAESSFTEATPFSFKYVAGAWDAKTAVKFKPLDGIMAGGASLDLGYDSDKGISAKAQNIAL
ncbi:MAG TPA: hypothetical protein VIA18_03135, partial [Polyangia bacterium]|nr:hypothetical protein [Polyangia bacterium]